MVWIVGLSYIKMRLDEGSGEGVLFCLYKICTDNIQTLKIFIKNDWTLFEFPSPISPKISVSVYTRLVAQIHDIAPPLQNLEISVTSL